MKDQKKPIDLQSVARVAGRIDLREIRLVGIEASCSPSQAEILEPDISFESFAEVTQGGPLAVACTYYFKVSSGENIAANATIRYVLIYDVMGGEDLHSEDLKAFAEVNGNYHCWPFLRQLLFDLTSKMGFPPLTLPVFRVSNSRIIKAKEGRPRKVSKSA